MVPSVRSVGFGCFTQRAELCDISILEGGVKKTASPRCLISMSALRTVLSLRFMAS